MSSPNNRTATLRRILFEGFWGRFMVLTGGRAFGALATFASTLLIAQYWGGETLGTLAVYLSVLSVMSVIASAGFPALGPLLAPQYRAQNQVPLLKSLIFSARRHMLVGSLVCTLIIFAFIWLATSTDLASSVLFSVVFAVAILATARLNFHGGVFVGLQRQYAGQLPEALIKPFSFLLFIVLLVVAKQNLSAEQLFLGFVVGVVLASTLSFAMVQKSTPMQGEMAAQPEVHKWRRAAFPWMLTTLASDLFVEFHILLTGYMAAASEVAVLHVAFRFRVLAAFGTRSIYMLFLPKIIAENAAGNLVGMQSNLMKMNLLVFGYACSVFCVFCFAGGFMMSLFGQSFESGWALLVVVSLSIVSRSLFGPAPAILAMYGDHKWTAILSFAILATSLLGSFLLYPLYGTMGVAVAFTSSNFLSCLVLWQVAKAKTQIDCSLFATVKQAIVAQYE